MKVKAIFKKYLKRIFVLACIFITSVASAEQIVIHKIKVYGLQRISLGTFLSYLPVKEGDRIDTSQTPTIIKTLYKTGFFNEVNLTQKNGELIITVAERPVIGSIKVSGNKKIDTKQLQTVLKTAGLVEGEAFDNSVLNSVEQALVQQYYNLGAYNAQVKTSIKQEARNRVAVNIDITEGPTAKIKLIRIIGNNAFSEKALLKNFTLTKSSIFTIFSSNDQYSKEKLDADLEKLRSFYFDHGYVNFKVDSAQVSITPDKKSIYITIHVTEGAIYKIKGFSVTGNLIGKRKEIYNLIELKPGDVFSRKTLLDIQTNLTMFLGVYGYGMPNIKIQPKIDDKTKLVFINFDIEPGKKIYVRRINIVGNTKTNDVVIRREIRQQEGGLFSVLQQEESKRRLANLGYLQDINTKIDPVPGNPDQVDLTYSVKDASSASANLQVGFSDADGFLYGLSINEQNLFGTGKSLTLGFDNSKDYKNYNISYYNPYFTTNNISLLTTGYAQFNNPGAINLSAYSANIYGGAMTFGFPFSDYNRLNLGYGVEHIEIGTTLATSQQVLDFIANNGSVYNDLKLISGWSFTNQDRAVFPTKGFSNSINLTVGVPLGKKSVNYYTADYTASYYHPIYKNFIFHARGEAGYGNGYGKTHGLPFFKNFYAGGIDSVRGFESGTLGPLDNFGHALGGNVITVASASVIFPNPVGDSLRTSVFTDVGNVYDNKFVGSQLRASAGIQGEWRSPLGPLVFALAKPISKHPGDNQDIFQFNIGTSL